MVSDRSNSATITSLTPRHDSAPRVALVYFGITRSLRLTIGSIQRNLVDACRSVTPNLRQFGHFYAQDRIKNARSKENGPLDPEEYRLLDLDAVEREAPGDCLALFDLKLLQAAGDPWQDSFASLQNLIHQLHSLRRATALALDWHADVVIFARPDLYYHASIAPYLQEMLQRPEEQVMLPDWASWRGCNDRIALARGETAIRAYGLRADRMGAFCAGGRKLHSEVFLAHALADVTVNRVPIHASRVRSTGMVVIEDFTPGRGTGGKHRLLPFADFKRTVGAESVSAVPGAAAHG